MKLSEIVAKPKNERTSDEQDFLIKNKGQLTLDEAAKEGLLPAEKKEEKSLQLSENQIAVDKEKFNSLVALAEKGAAAHEELRKANIEKEVKALVMSENGTKLPADQIAVAVDLLMGMSEEAATKYKAQLKALPEKQIFTENGNQQDVTGTAATADLDTKIHEYMEKNKVDYGTAASKVVAANPLIFNEYNANLPVAVAER